MSVKDLKESVISKMEDIYKKKEIPFSFS